MQNARWGGLVKGGSTWEFNSVCTYLRTMMSVFGPPMSENSNTKVSQHTKNHVAKIGLPGPKWATFFLVANMLPTFLAKCVILAMTNKGVALTKGKNG